MLARSPGKGREGCNGFLQKTPRAEGGNKVQGNVDPRFAPGLPFLVPKSSRSNASQDAGSHFQNLSGLFPPNFLQEPLQRSRKQLQSSWDLQKISNAVRRECLSSKIGKRLGIYFLVDKWFSWCCVHGCEIWCRCVCSCFIWAARCLRWFWPLELPWSS